MDEEDKIKAGILFCPADPKLKAIKLKTHNLNLEYNKTREDEKEKRAEILSQMLGAFGEGGFIQGPIAFHYGIHTKIGKNFFGNFNLVILDVGRVVISNDVQIAPNVSIYTAGHPIHPDSRNSGYEYGIPITIGDSVWIGGNAVILPGGDHRRGQRDRRGQRRF